MSWFLKVRACLDRISVRGQTATSITSIFMSCFVSKVGNGLLSSDFSSMETLFHSFSVSCVGVCYVCVYVGGTCLYAYICVHMCVDAHEGLRLTLAALLICVPMYSSKQGLSINPELAG